MKNGMVVCARMLSYLIVSVFLISCGSGGGGGDASIVDGGEAPLDGKISITCAEATNNQYVCEGTPERNDVAEASFAPSSVFNSGDVARDQVVYYQLSASNGTLWSARVYIVVDQGGVAGCEDRNITASINTFNVDSGTTVDMGTTGANYEICATNGASWANVTIYNGSHLLLNAPGMPAFDESLSTSTIIWNFTD